jgi:putative ABC transport system permease protein
MRVSEAVRTSLAEILSHKLRSLLTLIGIVLGTTAVVVMVSVIGGLAESVDKGLSDLGFDGVMFAVAQPPSDAIERKKQGYSRGLRTSDARVLEEDGELIAAVAPVVGLDAETVRVNGRTIRLKVEGVTPEWGRIRHRVPATGRYLVERDVAERATVAVLGSQLERDAFGSEPAVGRELLIRGVRFRIVGVLRPLGSQQVQNPETERDNSKIYVPITTAQKYFTGTRAVHAWALQVSDLERLAEAQREAKALLRRSHRGIEDFKIENIGEEILRVRREVDKLIANWNFVLGAIAAISLLVGGIGIFSVMQISISERVYEIGLRKAIGASDGEIFGQFLIESVSLSLVGGLLGSGLGYGITLLAGQAFEDGLAVSPLGLVLAAGFAILIGLTAGLWPALRASRLLPVDAIRAV